MKASVKQKSKFTRLGIALLFIVAAIVAAALVFSRFGGFGTGPSADTAEFAKYAQPVSEITVPEGASIIALGEATHGNKEFQELKLGVFEVMVEKYGVRAFALEADAGACETANRYIHGGEGTAEEAVAALVFTIYRTDQMAELLSWMRAYNETAAPGQDLRFYGFDMQSYEYSLGYLLEEAQAHGIDVTKCQSLEDGENRLALWGDGFSPLMYVLPQTYRVKREPAGPYDSMIFVAHAHPTEIASM